MLPTHDAELILDSQFKLLLPKEKYSAVYETREGRQLALERRSEIVAKVHFENVVDLGSLSLSASTIVEHLPPSRPRAHLPAPRLAGPYKERPGADAWRVRPASVADLNTVLRAYAPSEGSTVHSTAAKPESSDDLMIQPEDDESAFPEGVAAYRSHRALERDQTLSKRAKAKRVSETGMLACEVCGFDFLSKYGSMGEGFIEAHHIKPVSTLDGVTTTKLADLSLVCSNCHRMLHRGKPLMTPIELRAQLVAA